MQLTPSAPFPCGICGAPPSRREHLHGAELCSVCGFAIRLNKRGELVEWWTTNKSHPRGAWAAIVLLAVCLTGCATARRPPAAPPTNDPTRGVVSVIAPDRLGQGCPIGETLLLTAKHVATRPRLLGPPDGVAATWSDAEGHSGSAVTLQYDERRDLALMHADRPFRRWYALAEEAPALGERVSIVGYDFRDRLRRQVVRAEVVNVIATHLVLSRAGQPGFSGSCVLDRAARVVGIFIASVGLEPQYGLAVAVFGEWMPWRQP